MALDAAPTPPDVKPLEGGARLTLLGDWTLAASHRLEQKAQEIVDLSQSAGFVTLDLAGVTRLDTAGAWLINRARRMLARENVGVAVEHARAEHGVMLEQAAWRDFGPPPRRGPPAIVALLADLGLSVVEGFSEFYRGMAFLGEFVAAMAYVALNPRHFRMTSLVVHMELIGLRSAPIIILINLLVGGIVAQQGIFQLLKFGASSYTVSLIGILVLREMGVLLTSIMIAGRSGSAITAEIGSMKMREEIDALRVMGLSPIEVLIAPRVLALILSLPLLTFVADIAALFGGMLVSWAYGGISPAAFVSLLKDAIAFHTFMVGIIKAPFMALVIGLIAAMDGLATEGSAESLGRQVTSSVVKSIFMVILLDGLFAVFFAGINY
ncbi:ABC transporter permease [Methylocystis echinoides]|uniref:ABC transporter permease n=1 Tax=Methylocystis echinoides TaxID=29468 RepID=UPI00344333AD